MIAAIADRRALSLTLAAGAMLLLGALAAVSPLAAVGLAGVIALVYVALAMPVTSLVLLVFLTAIVPYSIQNRFGVGGGAGAPGILPSDLVLMLALLRALVVVPTMQLDRRRLIIGYGLVAFTIVIFLQLVRGFYVGASPSDVGAEFRRTLGFAAFFIALPLLEDARSRTRLFKALLGLGLVLGLWGLVQWAVQLPYSAEAGGDYGVRGGVRLTSGGQGQIQGGLYAFPVAIALSYAALVSGELKSLLARSLVIASLILNAIGAFLTFERTFWAASIAAVGLATLKAPGAQKLKVAIAAPIAILLGFAALATFAPDELTTARERAISLGQYRSDSSVRFRIVESRHVIRNIKESPIVGKGFAATIHFGRPYEQVRPETRTFSHNAYLWLSWKIGLPGALLLFGLIIASVLWRGRPAGGPMEFAMRNGAQAALVALLLIGVTFPFPNALPITTTMGLLLALAAMPPAEPQER